MSVVTDVIEDIKRIDTIEATKADKATTLSGYGITDALGLAGGTMTGAITSLRETSVAMAANDIDMDLGNYFTKTIITTTTLTVSNIPTAGNVGYFILELTNGGVAAVTYPSGTKFPKGTAPTLTAAGTDLLRFVTRDGGITWRATRIDEDSK